MTSPDDRVKAALLPFAEAFRDNGADLTKEEREHRGSDVELAQIVSPAFWRSDPRYPTLGAMWEGPDTAYGEPSGFTHWRPLRPLEGHEGGSLQKMQESPPIDMVLHCPACGEQHIDAPEPQFAINPPGPGGVSTDEAREPWTNPPHRSHLCHGCGHIWRPADVPTNGVAAIKTRGKEDSALSQPPRPVDGWEGKAREALERSAVFGELLLLALKANDSALAWIRETVRGAKAENATVGVIAVDTPLTDGSFWNRTKRVQGNLRAVARKARAALAQPLPAPPLP